MSCTPSTSRTKSLALAVLAVASCALALSASRLPPASHAAPLRLADESVQVFADDCATPQTVFYLGDTVCVRAGELPAPPDAAEHYRRITYAAPNLEVVRATAVWKDPEFDKFQIPDTGDHALPGTWRVHTVDIETNARADAKFTVRHRLTKFADLLVWKAAPDFVIPGDRARYTVAVRNDGPDTALSVEFGEEVPTNAYFYALRQTEGALFECQTPGQWERGQITCYGRGLKPGESATFDVYYVIDKYAREGDTCDGVTYATSGTEELNKLDNKVAYSVLVGGPEPTEPPPGEEP